MPEPNTTGRIFGCLVMVIALYGCGHNQLGLWTAPSMGDLTYAAVPRRSYRAELVTACGAGGLTTAGVDAIDRRPYVQRITTDDATIVWTAGDAARVRLTGPDGGEVATTVAMVDRSARPNRGSQYVARFGGLRPDTIYCYELTSDAGPLVLPTGFRTAPRADAGGEVRFVAMGDVGSRSIDQDAVKRQIRRVPFELAVIAGDVAYGGGSVTDLDRNFFAAYDQLLSHIPFFVAAGNHDYRTRSGAPLREAFVLPDNGGQLGRERWYSFDWGPVHFAVLDTELVGAEQATWLAADLEANSLPWVVVVMHRPAWSSGDRGGNDHVRRHFVPVFERYGVHLVLAGHEHHYERSPPVNGVTYVITGGGGRGTRPFDDAGGAAFAAQVAHFVHVTASPESLTLVAIDATGVAFDSARIER